MNEIYLDNAATMRVLPKVIKEMTVAYEVDYANPSSLHHKGYEIEKKITKSREYFANILGVSASEIFFTSGGTESNNWAIFGSIRANKNQGKHIITTTIEHPSILEVMKYLETQGYEIEYLPVDFSGKIKIEDLEQKVRTDTILISIMTVNNEIGSYQDIDKIAERVKKINPKTIIHSDFVQAFGKIKLPKLDYIDLGSIAAHKIGGPKGIGILYIKKGTKLKPLMFGGKHQFGLRPGTENYPLIYGFEIATRNAIENLEINLKKAKELRDLFLETLALEKINYQVHSQLEDTSPYILSLNFQNIRGEVLLHSLEEEGIYISTGSACQSKKGKGSHVLIAINSPNVEGSIRVSFGYFTKPEEVVKAANIMAQKIKQLQLFVRK